MLLLIAAGFLAYYNSFQCAFVFDDIPQIVDNLRVRSLQHPLEMLGHTARPVILLSLAVNYALGELNPSGYHWFNVVVHILAALTLFGVTRSTFLSKSLRPRFGEMATELAGVISLVWLVHPLQTESVTYVIQRAESVMGLSYLLTLYCVIRAANQSKNGWWHAAGVACCALGMASKPVMVTAPVVVLFYDRVFLVSSWRELLARRAKLYAGLAVTWLLLPPLLASGASEWKESAGLDYGGISPIQYALTQPGVILHYVRLALWPHPLCLDYGWQYGWPLVHSLTEALPDLLAITALLGGTIWAWRRNPPLAFLGIWFFVILAPTSSFLPLADLVFEHRMYLPLAAIVTAVTVSAFEFLSQFSNARREALIRLGFGLVAIVALLLTIRRNDDYRSELAVWKDTVAKCPNNPRAHCNLAVALDKAGKVKEAIEQLQVSLRIKPDYAEAHNDLGAALLKMGRAQEAATHCQQALKVRPDYADAHNNLALALWQTNKQQEAIEHWEQALRIRHDYADAHGNMANALLMMGKTDEAIGHYEGALRIQHHSAQLHNNLGIALEQAGRLAEAITHYQEALRLDPSMPQARSRLLELGQAQ